MPRRATPFMLRGYYLDLPFARAAHDFQAARLQAL